MAARAKKKVNTTPRVRGAKVVGPSFDGWENLEGSAFARLQRASHGFYYQDVKREELVPSMWDWMKSSGYTAAQISCAKKGATQVATPYVYARMLGDGCPDYNETYAKYWESLPGTTGRVKPLSEYLHQKAKEMIADGESKIEVAPKEQPKNVYKPTIQQVIFEQACDTMAEVDDWLDQFDTKAFDPKGIDIKSYLISKNTSQVHARKIIKMYDGELEEFNLLLNMPSTRGMSDTEKDLLEQLKEGYSHLTKKAIKTKRDALQSIIDACQFIIDSAASKRKPRKPKVRSADKIVKDVKYMKSDQTLNLVSINPVELVGANELWVYNVKTRKIGKYVASNVDPKGLKREGSGLSVKGTTLQGFDADKSVQKTLRKPDEKLKEFKAAGKVALRKYMDGISAVESTMTGRLNADTILLKVQ